MKNIPDKVAGNLYTTSDFNDGSNRELRTVVTSSGQGFDENDNAQLIKSIAINNSNGASYKESVGSTGASYLIENEDNLTQGLISLKVGATFSVAITNPNNTTTPELAFKSPALGPFNIKRLNGSNLIEEEIKTGFIVDFYYDGTDILIKNLNDATSLQDIESAQLYTVNAVVGNEYQITVASGTNPTAYFNGLTVKFINTVQVNSGAATVNINGIGPIAIADSTDRPMNEGDIGLNDLIVLQYSTSNNKFRVIKKTERINFSPTTNQLTAFDRSGDERVFANFNGLASPTSITAEHDKQTLVYSSSFNPINIQLPPIATLKPNFSCDIMLYEPSPNPVTFLAAPGEFFQRDGGNTTSYQIRVDNNSNILFKLHYFNPVAGLILSGADGANESIAGIARIAQQGVVDAGVDDTRFITPLKLKNVPFIQNLGVVYPIGTKFLNVSPLMVSDPESILPGGNTFTWAPVGTTGNKYASVVANPESTQTQGILGSNDIINGTTVPHTLIEAEMPIHHHIAAWGEEKDQYNPPWGLAAGYDGNNEVGSAATDNNNSWGNTSPKGGNQPHSHALDIRSYVEYGYIRVG